MTVGAEAAEVVAVVGRLDEEVDSSDLPHFGFLRISLYWGLGGRGEAHGLGEVDLEALPAPSYCSGRCWSGGEGRGSCGRAEWSHGSRGEEVVGRTGRR